MDRKTDNEGIIDYKSILEKGIKKEYKKKLNKKIISYEKIIEDNEIKEDDNNPIGIYIYKNKKGENVKFNIYKNAIPPMGKKWDEYVLNLQKYTSSFNEIIKELYQNGDIEIEDANIKYELKFNNGNTR